MSTTNIKQSTSELTMPEELEKFITIRDTEAHKELYDQKAKKLGISRSDYLRSIVWKEHGFIQKDYLKISLNKFTFKELKQKAKDKDLRIEEYVHKLILNDLHDVSQKPEVSQGPPKRLPNTPKPRSIPKKKPNNPHNLVFMKEMKETIQKGTKNNLFNIKDILKSSEEEIRKEREGVIREALLIDSAIKKALPFILMLKKLEVKEIGAN